MVVLHPSSAGQYPAALPFENAVEKSDLEGYSCQLCCSILIILMPGPAWGMPAPLPRLSSQPCKEVRPICRLIQNSTC